MVNFLKKCLPEYIKNVSVKLSIGFSNLINAVEPFFPVLIALVYFLCNKDFAGIQYDADEFGYLSKMILLSGRDIVYPTWWRFGYSLILLPVAWLTRRQSQFWYNFVIYQSLIWCVTFYMVRRFITFLRPDITVARRFGVLLFCAAYPTWCIVTGYAFTTTVMVFFYMLIITLLCRLNGTSFFEPLAAAVLAGLLDWIHPLGLAVYIPLVIAVFFGRKGSMKRCVVQVGGVIVTLVLFSVLYKILSSIIDNRMSDSISFPMNYLSGLRKDIELIFIPGFFFSYLSTLGLTTLGAGFCGLSAACHQMLGAFFKKIGSPLPEHTTNIVSFCALCVFATAAESALYFICLSPIPVYKSYYHWVYCRYLENVSLPLLVLCFLVKWKAVYFILPCVTLLAPCFGLIKPVTVIFDNQINVISLAVKNVCGYFKLLKGAERYLVTMHLIYTAVVISLVGLFARFRKIKQVFLCMFLVVSVIGIRQNLKRHHASSLRAQKYREFVMAAEKGRVKKTVTWDSFLHRHNKHISYYEYPHFPYARAAFWKAKCELDTTENWLKEKKGILITDYARPLLQHSDLYVYRYPLPSYKYIAVKTPLSGCEAYAANVFWEKNRWISADKILYGYSYPLKRRVEAPFMDGIFFAAPPRTRYLHLKFSQPVNVIFNLNGKRITSLTGNGLNKCFEITNVVRQYNELRMAGRDSLQALTYLESVKLEDELTADSQYFTAFSSPFRLYVADKENSSADSNALTVLPGQTQCGPHVSIPPGIWQVEVRGKNLNQGAYDVRMSYRNESVCRNIPTAEISPDLVSYLISHEQRTGDFEFRCHNGGKKALIIECITLKSVNKTEKGSRAVTKLPVLDTGFPFDRQILFSQPDIALFCYGFHSIEPAGRWAAKHAAIEMIFSKMPSSPVQVIFSISPLTKDQIMIIKTPDGKPQKTLKVPCRGTYVHTLDRKYFLNNGRIARIGLSFPNAKKPGTADSRVLSCFFSGIEARLLEDLRAGREVVFNKYSVFFQSGFAVPENWGTWSNEKNCVMRFSLPVDRKSENVHLQFTCQAYAKMKSVKIYCNGKYAAAWNIQKHDPQIYDLKLNVPLTKRNVELRFEQFDVASPQEVTRSSDQRKLGLGFISMRYISENISPGDSILLNTPNLFFRKGFSPSEEWGTWSNEKNCVMRFSLPVDRKSEYVHLQFTCKAYAKMKSVKIYCNGKYAAAWNIRKHDPQVYDLKLNVPLTKRNVELRFEQFDVASPQEVAGSSDRRKLGLGFISLKYISENTVPQGK